MADIQQEIERSIARVSEGIDLLKEENARLRALLREAHGALGPFILRPDERGELTLLNVSPADMRRAAEVAGRIREELK